MSDEKIKAHLVNGFLEAGKTSFIQDFITGDFFHKKEKGKTLVLVFEEGETAYDRELLSRYKTDVAVWEYDDKKVSPGSSDKDKTTSSDFEDELRKFIRESIDIYKPDRIFAELNVFMEGLSDVLYEELDVMADTLLIDAGSLEMYYRNMTELLAGMIRKADPVIINRAESKESLEPFSTPFRLLNPKAGFLWESPMGYHEKVFGNAVPFDKTKDHIVIRDEDFPAWYLDGLEFPGDYAGKTIEADVQVCENITNDRKEYKAGRNVMTCCINDISFLGFEIDISPVTDPTLKDKAFYHMVCKTLVKNDAVTGRRSLLLQPGEINPIKPKDTI